MVVGIAARPHPTLLLLALGALTLVSCTTPEPADGRLRGDAGLIDEISGGFPADFERAAVAVVDEDQVRTAYVDADESTVFEIGSMTKALTGELFAEAIERREVAPEDTLGEHLDLGDSPVASVTLLQLATHHAGVPIFPDDPEWIAEFESRVAAGENPLDDDLDEMLALARSVSVTPDAEFEYSNLGAALLGQALASAAGTEYPELLQTRVFDPLGMTGAVLVETPDQVPDTHAGGFTPAGDAVEPWSLGAFSPAGGVHATLADLIALARAVMGGALAHSEALEPITDGGSTNFEIGYFWFVETDLSRTTTGTGGLTGGFGSALLIDRAEETAAIVLANTGSDPSDLTLRLLIAAER